MSTLPPEPRGMDAGAPPPAPRPPAVERLRPLLYRHFSAVVYRRSERFARHVARVGPARVLPLPPLVDRLAVWLAERLPAGLVARLGPDGLFRAAKLLVALLKPVGFIGSVFAQVALSLLRSARRARSAWRFWRTPVDTRRFDARPPVGYAGVVLGGVVRFRGFRFDNNLLTCWFERVRPFDNPCQIFVHLHPAEPQARAALAPLGRFARDHDPQLPLSAWPPRRAYRDETLLSDLPPGDYRVAVGIFDLAAGQRLTCVETGGSAVELGWVRVTGTAAAVATPDPSGAAAAARRARVESAHAPR